MSSVRLESVKKVYDGGQVAVHGMDLEIQDKEFIVLVGPSGCGKSTTLRMIAGLEEVTEGTISIDGQTVNDAPPKDRDIAMVFQNYALYPHMSVYENMAFGLKLRKFPTQEIEQRVRDAAGILGIENLLDRKPKALSGGQRQRVALGRAIVRKPKVFLFDEPLSNLDAKLRVQTRTEISKLHDRLSATMVYVTHDQMEAMTLGDRIVVMKDGHVQQIAPPLELYHHPCNKFVAGFIGSPAMNFFGGTLQRKSGIVFQADTNGLLLPVDKKYHKRVSKYIGKSVTLGLRPEHIASKSRAKAGKAKARAHIEVVEPMGNESLVYFTTGKDGGKESTQYVARLNGVEIPEAGKPIDLAFDMSQAHFFDAATEKVI